MSSRVGQQIATGVEAVVVGAASGAGTDILVDAAELLGFDGAVEQPVPGEIALRFKVLVSSRSVEGRRLPSSAIWQT